MLLAAAALSLAVPVIPARADDGIRFWTSVLAGRSSLAGDPSKDTQAVTASMVTDYIGGDIQLDDSNLVGASLGLGRQTFSAAGGNGRSDDISLALYGRHFLWDGFYIAESLGYGWHDVSTRRVIQFLGTEILDASFQAHDIGGRVEGGYTFRLDDSTLLAPFAAFVGDSYDEPAYQEAAVRHDSLFAASYAANTIGITHMELGARATTGVTLLGANLALDALAGWERQLDSNPYVIASFQTLPGSTFVLRGTSPAQDTALIGAGARYQSAFGLSLGLRADARVGAGTTIVSGTMDMAWLW